MNLEDWKKETLEMNEELKKRVPPIQLGRIQLMHKRRCLIEATVMDARDVSDGLTAETRCYELAPAKHQNGYHSFSSGGQEHWTDKDQGPQGEEIVRYRNWVLMGAEGGFVGSFLEFEHALYFIVAQLRRKIGEVVYE